MRRTSSDEVDNEINRINEDTRKSSTSISKSMLSLPKNPSGSLKNQSNDKPKSPYSAFTHQIRKIVPEEMACMIGCGGEKCKYCNSNWPVENMVINGIFSNW
jgi:hypothetical protein